MPGINNSNFIIVKQGLQEDREVLLTVPDNADEIDFGAIKLTMMQLKAYFFVLDFFFASGLFAQSAEECLYGTITLNNGKNTRDNCDGAMKKQHGVISWKHIKISRRSRRK